jgi:hypothetical protein
MPSPISPLGKGLVVRCIAIAPSDVLKMGALLAGYDQLASIHNAPDGTTMLVTTIDRANELDDVLGGLRDRVAMDVLPLA